MLMMTCWGIDIMRVHGRNNSEADMFRSASMEIESQGQSGLSDASMAQTNQTAQKSQHSSQFFQYLSAVVNPSPISHWETFSLSRLHRPFAVALDLDGSLLVCDSGQHRILRFQRRPGQGEASYAFRGEAGNVRLTPSDLVACCLLLFVECILGRPGVYDVMNFVASKMGTPGVFGAPVTGCTI